MPRYCIEPRCFKRAFYNHPGDPPMFCKSHTDFEGGMVDVANKRCGCGKFPHHGDYCLSCYNEKNGIVKRVKEKTFKNYLKNRFPELCLKTEYYILTYKIDFLIELEELFIALEHDEKQHKDNRRDYPPERETKRENQIFEKLSEQKRTVLIRFNPSNYRIRGKLMKTPLEQRLEKLEDLISECIFDENKSGIFKLFYDE